MKPHPRAQPRARTGRAESILCGARAALPGRSDFRPGILSLFRLGWGPAGLLLFVLLSGCRSVPPHESGTFRPADLVELVRLDPALHLDIRYATTNNFLGRPVYRQSRAFLQRPAAAALARADRNLHQKGYGLVIFDGYGPWSVTKTFWDAATAEQRRIEFVANPKKGSRHNRGCAVDLTLYDLSTGQAVPMPSAYDEFTERAYPNYQGGPAEARRLRDLLRAAMESEGFTVYQAEWWHFDYNDWKSYRILNLPFEQLGE